MQEATDSTLLLLNKVRILTGGIEIATLRGNSSEAIENWVVLIAKMANAKVDWYYRGGEAKFFHLGNKASRERVLKTINELAHALDGDVLSINKIAFFKKGTSDLKTSSWADRESCVFAAAQ